ncbi:MAG: M20/M25/M40 family metallo-hydrolase [Phycisphaerae bacterium]|nr:M20/M25/M40 family metallo-hydrolase [Phycisphaerae bacterium]
MYDLLRGRNEGLKQDVTGFAQQLIRTPGLSLHEKAVADRVEQEMRRVGYDEVFRDDAGNVVGVMLGRGSDEAVLLGGHLDTVEPSEAGPWERDPWSGELVGDRLFGLGASDCKGGLAAQIYAGLLLKRAMLPLRGNLVVAATVAEESGRSAGLRTLLDRTMSELSLRPVFAVLGEPTNLGLYYGHNGWFEMDIWVEAAEQPRAARAARVIYDQFATAAGALGSDEIEQITLEEPRYVESAQGCRAGIRMARRLHPSENAQQVADQVKHTAVLAAQAVEPVAVEVAICEETKQLYNGRTTVVRHVTHAWETDPFNSLLSRAKQALEAGGCPAQPGKWRLGRMGMATGGGVLVNDFKVPTIGYGPGCEEAAHAPNEFVTIPNIHQAVYGTALIVHSLIGVPVYGWTFDDEI